MHALHDARHDARRTIRRGYAMSVVVCPACHAEMSLDVVGGPPSRVTDRIKTDAAKWKKVIDDASIKVD